MLPLSERMRPTSLDGYIGQRHLVGAGGVLRRAIESGVLPSFILWGPPGVGKTTLAKLLAHQLTRPFYALSAINSGVKDIREVIDKAKADKFFNAARPVLFIDEIHRFSKAQQDSLLGAVEQGIVTLVGATTENPSFEVISALLSRCQVYTLRELTRDELVEIVVRALSEDEYLRLEKITIVEYEALLRYSGGDGRRLLNLLELVVNTVTPDDEGIKRVTNEAVAVIAQQNPARYDKSGEQHYDIVSAFIKSVRGSDPNAALYWMARMLEGGEDPIFIARRILILAAEDIGLANPNALLLADACFRAVQILGMPECRIVMSETVIYLATSLKSNTAITAIDDALTTVRTTGDLDVPLHLRNAPTKLMKELGYGKAYQYPHDYAGNFVVESYLPPELETKIFYPPADNPPEQTILVRLRGWWQKYR